MTINNFSSTELRCAAKVLANAHNDDDIATTEQVAAWLALEAEKKDRIAGMKRSPSMRKALITSLAPSLSIFALGLSFASSALKFADPQNEAASPGYVVLYTYLVVVCLFLSLCVFFSLFNVFYDEWEAQEKKLINQIRTDPDNLESNTRP